MKLDFKPKKVNLQKEKKKKKKTRLSKDSENQLNMYFFQACMNSTDWPDDEIEMTMFGVGR